MTLLISENGVSRGAHLPVQPGPDAHTGSRDKGGIQYQETVPGATEKCSSQVSTQSSGQSFHCTVFCKI